jgi:hypothetical protein
MTGVGRWVDAQGKYSYTGTFEDELRSGYGDLRALTGRQSGQFKNHLFSGFGTYSFGFKQESKIIGPFVGDEMHGSVFFESPKFKAAAEYQYGVLLKITEMDP